MTRLLTFAFLCIPLTLPAEVTVQGAPEETRVFLSKGQSQVTLAGQSSMVIEASEVKAEVHVTSEGVTPGAVLSLHDEQKRSLLNKMQAVGIARGQITVPKFATLSPRFGASGGEQPIGYIASSILTVEINEQKQHLDLMSVLDKSREARLGNLSYDHAQLSNIQKQVLAAACKRVMTRKEVYEQALGVTLRPVSFSEAEGADQPHGSDQNRFGQITIKRSVQIVFEIQPAAAAAITSKPGQPQNPEPSGQP